VKRTVYITGGTGFIGSAVVAALGERGLRVKALVRPGSEPKAPGGCEVVTGDPLDANSFSCAGAQTFIQLVGSPHPTPWRGAAFRSIDLVAGKAAIRAADRDGVQHFVYVSVAHPAPVMKAYIEVRSECERLIRETGLCATILRPWYVLGPGRSWPYALLPLYKAAEHVPSLREGARRLGLVTQEEMVRALVWAVENPPERLRIMEVPQIRAVRLNNGLAVAQ
jgi:uncharacterized protein YbjT (DUF2867 family)